MQVYITHVDITSFTLCFKTLISDKNFVSNLEYYTSFLSIFFRFWTTMCYFWFSNFHSIVQLQRNLCVCIDVFKRELLALDCRLTHPARILRWCFCKCLVQDVRFDKNVNRAWYIALYAYNWGPMNDEVFSRNTTAIVYFMSLDMMPFVFIARLFLIVSTRLTCVRKIWNRNCNIILYFD